MNSKFFGITGQNGSYLCELLLNQNYEVHGVIKRSSSINTSRIDHVYEDPQKKRISLFLHYGDINDSISVSSIIKKIIKIKDKIKLMNTKHYAFIPVRKGSKGFKNKNLMFFKNTADFFKRNKLFDEVYVSSNDNKIKNYRLHKLNES